MKYLSVCAGIEAATVAWHHMGWEAAGYSEIEKFPSLVLDHHYPNVPKLGDMTKYKEWDIGTIDLLVGGTPCQSFSVAGLRKGMADPRGNLALVYCGILDHFRPRWFVWENVPGVLSSNGGRDFGSFLGALAELGYGVAYRVLDAQWFGVAQRRRRVFVVGYLGDWRRAAAVLFERQSLRRNLAPSREKRQITPTLTKEGTGVSRTGHNEDGWYIPTVAATLTKAGSGGQNFECGDTYIPEIMSTLNANDGKKWGSNQWVNEGKAIIQPVAIQGNVDAHRVAQPIPLDLRNAGRDPEKHDAVNRQGVGVGQPGDPAHTVTTACVHGVAQIVHGTQDPCVSNIAFAQGRNNGGENVLVQPMAVRRLTPTECERLQGFPDGYTDIQPNGKKTPDGPRYKALGNSMAVPVMRWIGERINNAP